MVEPTEKDESLDLESLSLDELERKPVSDSESGDVLDGIPSAQQGPRTSRRCDSSHREFLNNSFNVED